jgi:hypothetical protein
MPGRSRSTKKLAQRIDLNYFKRLYPISRWRRNLTFAVLGIAALGLGWVGLTGSQRVFSAGPLDHSHVLLNCAACHVAQSAFARKVTDTACLACHDGPIHHVEQTFTPACAECHVEHQGSTRMASIRAQTCTQCHAALKTKITGFTQGHPEFAALASRDPGGIRFNHQVHAADNLRGPRGAVHLACSDCHTREHSQMLPIEYKKHCAGCHPLMVPGIGGPAPHDTPDVVASFLAGRTPMTAGMWQKACEQCHTLSFGSASAVPAVAAAQLPARWFRHASFDHDAHQKLTCTECHSRALTSAVSADVLLPGIESCRKCHQSSTCAECHVYHDWTKGRRGTRPSVSR